MADPEHTGAVLGKRPHDDVDGDGEVPAMPPADMEDSSDEEIGPMPVPEGTEGVIMTKGRKKKRAGE